MEDEGEDEDEEADEEADEEGLDPLCAGSSAKSESQKFPNELHWRLPEMA